MHSPVVKQLAMLTIEATVVDVADELVIDLQAVSFLDPAGVRMLLVGYEAAMECGTVYRVVNAPQQPGKFDGQRVAAVNGPWSKGARLVHEYHGLDPVPQSQLGQEMGDVGLDRCRADIQVGCHFGVGVSAGDQPQHIRLPRGQPIERYREVGPVCG